MVYLFFQVYNDAYDEGEDKTKKKNGTWDPDNMHTAIKKVLSKQMSSRQAPDKYEVPRTTLDDRIRAIKNKKLSQAWKEFAVR